QLNIHDKEYYLTTYGTDRREVIDGIRFYRMIDLDGNSRGEVWIDSKFQSVAGVITNIDFGTEELGTIRFAAPAETEEEGKDLLERLLQE
ncbi:hypothetical protein ACERII_22925, partial [Evansella sp. AB-rgal1]|uniref:hypothetical protein n=1 Tax=Evansella sp. AB-rgal1 TaxID=3242696 RepID=UPI00359D8AFB